MRNSDPDLDAAPRWMIVGIHIIIGVCAFFLAAAFFTAISRLP